jgi:hypothetical protein
MNAVFESILYIYLIYHKEFIVENLADAYRDIALEKISRIFVWGTFTDFIINLIMYSFGIVSVRSHKITTYNSYVCTLMFSILAKIVISYLNMYEYFP